MHCNLFFICMKKMLYSESICIKGCKTIYLNFISDNYFNKKNLLRYGLSYNLDNYDEIFRNSGYSFDRDLHKIYCWSFS